MSSQFDALEREIINETIRRVLHVIDNGAHLFHAGLYSLDDKVSERLRDVRDELKALRGAEPKPVTRPRVWTESDGSQFRVVNGLVEWRTGSDACWQPEGTEYVARYKAVADLLANPTETVDA